MASKRPVEGRREAGGVGGEKYGAVIAKVEVVESGRGEVREVGCS